MLTFPGRVRKIKIRSDHINNANSNNRIAERHEIYLPFFLLNSHRINHYIVIVVLTIVLLTGVLLYFTAE